MSNPSMRTSTEFRSAAPVIGEVTYNPLKVGYTLSTNINIKCLQESSLHINVMPINIFNLIGRCSCGSPPSIYKAAHNAVTNQNYIGSEVSYSCVKGYRDPEAGSMKRRCTYNKAATWVLIGQELFCEGSY